MAKHPDRDGPAEAVVEELLQVTGQLLRRLRAESNPSGLTWSQAVVLARLGRNGAMTTADLARAEAVKPQSMGVTLAGLERDGLVERRPHPTDGRQFLFALTAKGAEIRRRRRLLKREWLSGAMARLDPEDRRTLAAALAVIRRLGET
ncbi:MAG: MarR family transcriptional regulator [Proteobacteria bacterium]|nr:MarR family transcriptional regulator [Pseudomonadota bacterium]